MEHPHRTITPLSLTHADPFEGSWTRRGSRNGSEFMCAVGLSAAEQEASKVLNSRAHVFRTPDMGWSDMPRVGLFMEQAPNPDSRVFLSDRRDALGMRRVILDWQLTDLDWHTYQRTAMTLSRAFERAGLGALTGTVGECGRDREPVLHSNHHLGTTRMSLSEDDGVVDANCLTHDLENLYIVGGSVFPTVSWANPTFTLMALTFRLADHLRGKLT